MTAPTHNRQFRLKARPTGMVSREHFDYLADAPVPAPGDGEILVRVEYLSLDPAMRGWMNDARSYIAPVALGDVMRAGGVGRVVRSNDPGFSPGDCVSAMTGIQEYAVVRAKDATRVDPSIAPLPRYLGALGMTGLTAYFGLLDVGQPKAGDTVVVSGAAGAVGTIAGQIARAKGCRAIGIAGGEAKCRWLTESMGFDGAVDYKRDDFKAQLRAQCPKGIDVYFDNVGGDVLDAALATLARRARVVICGAISQYNSTTGVQGPKNYLTLLVQRARMEGFVVFDYASRYAEGVAAIAQWIAEGKVTPHEEVVQGIEVFPEALQKLFRGENTGKLVLAV